MPIQAKLVAILGPYLTPERAKMPYLLSPPTSHVHPSGDHHLNERVVNQTAQMYAKAAGLPVGRSVNGFVFHDLRRHFETTTVNSGVPQLAVDAWMDHVGRGGTGRTYYDLKPDESRRLMANVAF